MRRKLLVEVKTPVTVHLPVALVQDIRRTADASGVSISAIALRAFQQMFASAGAAETK
jgi:hypothetical protein